MCQFMNAPHGARRVSVVVGRHRASADPTVSRRLLYCRYTTKPNHNKSFVYTHHKMKVLWPLAFCNNSKWPERPFQRPCEQATLWCGNTLEKIVHDNRQWRCAASCGQEAAKRFCGTCNFDSLPLLRVCPSTVPVSKFTTELKNSIFPKTTTTTTIFMHLLESSLL